MECGVKRRTQFYFSIKNNDNNKNVFPRSGRMVQNGGSHTS